MPATHSAEFCLVREENGNALPGDRARVLEVRIQSPPAASQVRTRAGVEALIFILDNHEFFRQVGVALTTV